MGNPPSSRQQLGWHVFTREQTGEWKLVLKSYYAELFSKRRPAIMLKSHTGWRDNQTGRFRYAYFRDLDESDIANIQSFLTTYSRLVIIGLNEHIAPFFSNELDACVALDFNMTKRDDGSMTRTEIGEWEYQAKYHQTETAVEDLRREMKRVIPWIPGSRALDPAVKRCLSYIPAEPGKSFHLPRILAQRLDATLPDKFAAAHQRALIDARLTGPKASLKNVTFEQKIAEWERITSQHAIALSRPVQGYAVYIIDDMYQSGATLWSYAKYLKSAGASQVFGLVCVKSLRDTDNV